MTSFWSVFRNLYPLGIAIGSYNAYTIINSKSNLEGVKPKSFLNLATTSLTVMELPYFFLICVYLCIVKISLKFSSSLKTKDHLFSMSTKFSKKLKFLSPDTCMYVLNEWCLTISSNLMSTYFTEIELNIFFCFYMIWRWCFVVSFFNWDSLHSKLNSHYEACSYNKKDHKKIKVYRKSVQKELNS